MGVCEKLFDLIGTALREKRRKRIHYECRHCGTTLPRKPLCCPSCGTEEIAGIVL